ncbi:MAG: glutaredoxin family protein [Terriglobales bacterium]
MRAPNPYPEEKFRRSGRRRNSPAVVAPDRDFRSKATNDQIDFWPRAHRNCYTPGMPDAGEVILYSRKGCHLCEIVKESLNKLQRQTAFRWREIDVDSDSETRRLYNDEVPVVFINGRKAFKYHMDEQEFLRKLER